MQYLNLYLAFFRIGLFTFGGGYAMLPMLERECVTKTGWITKDELLDIFSISQCTPGVIAVNTATYIGNKKGRLPGAICTTLGVISPSLIIITLIAALLENFAEYAVVQHALAGIRVAVSALIVATVVKLIKSNVRSAMQIVMAVFAFFVVGVFGASPVIVVLVAGLFGFLYLGRPVKKEEDHE